MISEYIEKLPKDNTAKKQLCQEVLNKLSEKKALTSKIMLQDGHSPPQWFIDSYRHHNIFHEVTDILKERYFISPPQVGFTNSHQRVLDPNTVCLPYMK